jgi:hypothetical protein
MGYGAHALTVSQDGADVALGYLGRGARSAMVAVKFGKLLLRFRGEHDLVGLHRLVTAMELSMHLSRGARWLLPQHRVDRCGAQCL